MPSCKRFVSNTTTSTTTRATDKAHYPRQPQASTSLDKHRNMKLPNGKLAQLKCCCLLLYLTAIGPLHVPAQQESKLDLEEPSEFFRPNSLHNKFTSRISFDQYVTYALRSVSLVAGFDNDLHRYDNQLDLINSFERNLTYGDELGALRAHIDSSELSLLSEASELTLIENELNQETCAKQLDFIYEETMNLFRDYNAFTQSKRLDLIDFIDSFGAAPSEQLLMANSLWLGSFDQCQGAQIERSRRSETAQKQRPELIRGRYCVAHLRLPSWSRAKQADKISLGSESIKLGVCLPRACNSISILRHSNRIEALIRLARLQQVPYSSLKLTQLYCLPDENSPLRQLSHSARLFIGLVSLWLLLVVYASLKYELLRAKYQTRAELQADPASGNSKLIQVFAFRYAWRRLFSEPPSEIAPRRGQQRDENLIGGAAQQGHLRDFTKSTIVMKGNTLHKVQEVMRAEAHSKPIVVGCGGGSNLAAIDGIKAISMIWLISAHTLLFFIRTIANGRQFWSLLLDARVMTIMAGIFPVDSFFTVTGVLTSYLKFKPRRRQPQQQAGEPKHNLMRSPSYWLEIFVHRYLRFMPMYLLIFWYTRDLSEFIGSGPMWDYATASTSLRSICKRESLWVPILFQANFKPIEQHCVKPAWYLANDYQYLLITPLFMLLLVASRWLGYLVIALSVFASLIMQFLTVYQQQQNTPWWPAWLPMGSSANEDDEAEQFSDFESLINFKPMFATYVLKNLWRLYVLPYNRIPPYLIGLLTGHLMYCHLKRNQSVANSAELPPCSSPPDIWCAPNEEASRENTTPIRRHSPPSSTESLVSSNASTSDKSNKNAKTTLKRPSALGLLLRHVNLSIWTPVGLLLAVVYLPKVSQLIQEQRGVSARIGASLIIALMRLVWSLAVARLIFICFKASMEQANNIGALSRSFVINLLASPKWRPWSKICLSVLLIQWEVIAYLAQIQPVQNLTVSLLLAYVIICIVVSYVVGLLLYLLFEFPLSQIEQLYISPKLFAKSHK